MKAFTCLLQLVVLISCGSGQVIENLSLQAQLITTTTPEPDGKRETHCVFNRTEKQLQCDSNNGTLSCDADILGFAESFTQYRISRLKESRGENPVMWFRIYARKEDKSGWYFFKGVDGLPVRMTIHSKLKKVKKYDQGFVVNDIECWKRLRTIIASSNKFKQVKIERYISEEDEFTEEESRAVKTIGTLTIV